MLHGTSVANTTVTVTRFGVGVIGTAATDGSGNWSLDYTGTALPDGDTLFTAAATDASNRTGPQTNPALRIVIDTIAPAAPVIADIADAGALVFTGAAKPGSLVRVNQSGVGVIASGAADALGNWTAIYTGSPLTPGPHSFTASATDLAGNTGPSSASSSIDTTVATPLISGITDDTGPSTTDGVTSDDTLVISGTATAGNTITVKRSGTVIGTTVTDGTGHWSFDNTGSPLANGTHAFSASASNGGPTSASSPAFLVKVDTVAPAVVSVTRQNPTAASSSSASITFRVTFSEPVIGVDPADFTTVFSAGLSGSISGVNSAGPSLYDVTISPLSGEGTVRLDVNASGTGIGDNAGNPLAAGFTTGQTFARLLTGPGVWIRNATGGLWGSNPNWQDGIVGSGINNLADFTTLELVDDNIVHLDSPRTLGNLVFGDTDISSPASWIIDDTGNPANILTLAVGAGTPSIAVNPLGVGATATISARLAGNQGLTKLGAGTLLLNGLNTLTGTTNISAGILRIGAGGASSAGVVNVSAGGAQLNIAGGAFTATGNLTVNAGSGSALIVDSGTAGFAGMATNNSAGGILRINGGSVTATSVNLPRSSDATPSFAVGFIVTGGNTTVNGPVSLGTNNSWGSMSVEGGSLTVNGIVTVANQQSANRGGQMRVTGGTFTATNSATGILMCRNNGTNTNNVATATFSNGVSNVEKFTLGFDGTVTAGSATITINGGALYVGS
ncbi:MAG TPA: Ig-like domain-containing protein, partial [Blastocatellia bacterium]|nr:Ig-like domain-containing protein [Blastocatellia bacterium]